MFQWLYDNKEWLFGGLGVAIFMGVMKYFNAYFVKYFKNRFLRNIEEEFEKKFNDRLGEVISENPSIFAEIKVDDDEVEFYCVTYRMNKNRKMAYDETWMVHDKFKITHTPEGFIIRKEEIGKRLRTTSDPYKFYMTTPRSSEIINKYYVRLLEAEHVVTGHGEPDGDKDKWRIWFLLHNQPIHPYPQSPSSLNHTLVNQVYIRSKLYNDNRYRQLGKLE